VHVDAYGVTVSNQHEERIVENCPSQLNGDVPLIVTGSLERRVINKRTDNIFSFERMPQIMKMYDITNETSKKKSQNI